MNTSHSPFPLGGGRAGDGGGTTRVLKKRPTNGSVSCGRGLRGESTVAERALWKALQAFKLNFRRQVAIGRSVADFAHHESKLLIEIDGHYHGVDGAPKRDAARDTWLVAEGFRTIRFGEKDIRDHLETVVERILAETVSPPSPILPLSGGKGEEVRLA